MKSYSELVIEAIEKAHKDQEELVKKTTFVTKHEGGVETLTTYYKKNGAIWCKTVTGCIVNDNRVYKVMSDKPYVRVYGRYWYLDESGKSAVAALL